MEVRRSLRHVVWDLTDGCNLRCLHCELSAGQRDPEELDHDEALALTAALSELGCLEVSLSGGEPLLRRDWPELAAALIDRGVDVRVVTNGLLLDDAAVSEMTSLGVRSVSVSLDGLGPVHDELRRPPAGVNLGSRFDSALAALERVVASPMRAAVITLVHRLNIDDLEAMEQLLVELGVDLWQLQLAYPLGRLLELERPLLIEPEALPSLEQRLGALARAGRIALIAADNIGYYGRCEPAIRAALHGRSTFYSGCMAGVLGLGICSNGDVKGCPCLPRVFRAGNVRKEPLATIWSEEERFAYNTRWSEQQLAGGCRRCSYRQVCRGGCTAMAWAVTGTIADNPFCLQRYRR